jgi:hypothetical protein
LVERGGKKGGFDLFLVLVIENESTAESAKNTKKSRKPLFHLCAFYVLYG